MAWLASTCSPLRMGQFRGTDDSQRALRRAHEDTAAGGGVQTGKDRIYIHAMVEMLVVTFWGQKCVMIGANDVKSA